MQRSEMLSIFHSNLSSYILLIVEVTVGLFMQRRMAVTPASSVYANWRIGSKPDWNKGGVGATSGVV